MNQTAQSVEKIEAGLNCKNQFQRPRDTEHIKKDTDRPANCVLLSQELMHFWADSKYYQNVEKSRVFTLSWK